MERAGVTKRIAKRATQVEKQSPSRIGVIGIGGAGVDLTLRLRRAEGDVFSPYICADLDGSALAALPASLVIRLVELDRLKDLLPTAKREIEDQLTGTSAVILIAGLGGTCGSTYSVPVASATHAIGIKTLGIYVTPFEFEYKRVQMARRALSLSYKGDSFDRIAIISNADLAAIVSPETSLSCFYERVAARVVETARAFRAAPF